MKTIIICLIALLICQTPLCQNQDVLAIVGAKKHISDKGVSPIQNITILDIPEINSNPDVVLVAKEVRNAQYGPGALIGVVNSISVGYDDSIGRHYIKYDNPDIIMAAGTTFNVMYAPKDTAESVLGNFTHSALASTIFPAAPYATVMDYALTNNDDTWNFLISKKVDEDEIFNDLPLNLNYNFYGSGEWVIRSRPNLVIPENSEYNIIGDTSSVYLYDHVTTPENINEILISITEYAYFTNLSHPFIDNNPDAIVYVEPIIPEGSGSSFYFEHSMYYNSNTGLHEIHIDLPEYISDFSFPTNITFKIYGSNESSLGTTDVSISEHLKVFPNPAQTIINFEASTTIIEIELFNILGQKLDVIKGRNSRDLQINVSQYHSGNYIAKVTMVNRTQTIRLV